MGCGNWKTSQRGDDDRQPCSNGNGHQKILRANNLVRYEALAGKSVQKRLREEDRANGTREGRRRGPPQRGLVAGGLAAEQRGDAFEVVVGAVGVGEKT